MSVAGAYSSGQRETAGVYELQSQVVRDAPQEVSSLAPAVIKMFWIGLFVYFLATADLLCSTSLSEFTAQMQSA